MTKGRHSNVKIAALEASKSSTSTPSPEEVSIDDLMSKGLKAMYGVMRAVNADAASGAPSRNTVMNLKDLMSMLKELKKEEQNVLSVMSEEDLEKIVKK